ncbi:tripartite tricarboxylate transporter substrate binding protein [Franzmannia qiaohouensis]|uniref:Tripartite tricarboxylate transporter substrate binding protein n=1 Tax=Franzmannia qiaohouensis TaxID=1329370 RepID=A0ABU1HAE2_9GAMM|nr:tripartite tricarboxylate transporter substrate binding protein [Halomonas qiaohouensis]MDR5903829.1 tripartite tricarboxylate transporter substrate binding protein [Halomonas qiaohouensis]
MHNVKLKKTATTLATAIAVATAGMALTTSHALADGWEPEEQLNITIAFGPGGGNDVLSRTLIDILEKYDLYPENIVATNRPGGSGAVGWGYVFNQEGNPYHLSTTSGSFIATPLQADTPWDTMSFTHIALMAADDQVLVVNGDSDIQDFDDYLEWARENPPAVGGIGSVNNDFIVAQLLSQEAGYDYDYVPFNQQGELTTALLSKSVDAMVATPGSVIGLIESGDFRALAFSGETVPDALEGVPSFAELGYGDAAVAMPRGLIMPPGVPEEAREWWIDTIAQVVETPEWAEYVEANFLTENVQFGDDFTDFLESTINNFETILTETGAI